MKTAIDWHQKTPEVLAALSGEHWLTAREIMAAVGVPGAEVVYVPTPFRELVNRLLAAGTIEARLRPRPRGPHVNQPPTREFHVTTPEGD